MWAFSPVLLPQQNIPCVPQIFNHMEMEKERTASPVPSSQTFSGEIFLQGMQAGSGTDLWQRRAGGRSPSRLQIVTPFLGSGGGMPGNPGIPLAPRSRPPGDLLHGGIPQFSLPLSNHTHLPGSGYSMHWQDQQLLQMQQQHQPAHAFEQQHQHPIHPAYQEFIGQCFYGHLQSSAGQVRGDKGQPRKRSWDEDETGMSEAAVKRHQSPH